MDALSEKLLVKLLDDAEKVVAGRRTRAAGLTATDLRPYSLSRDLNQRESFEAALQAAVDAGAISMQREKGFGDNRSVSRVDVASVEQLASFLGRCTRQSIIAQAAGELEPICEAFPVVEGILARWRSLGRVRGSGPEDTRDWLDAAAVIEHLRGRSELLQGELPVREVSANLFRDSKRIETLTVALDVLLSGDIACQARPASEVWYEIGLKREEQPILLAGAVTVRRTRVTALLDEPYGAFSAASVIGLDAAPEQIISIENKTTFHSEASRRSCDNVLLIYTAGMPSPSWRAMYQRLLADLPPSVPVMHWGDVDEGGFRIAANVQSAASAQGHKLFPFRMNPSDIPTSARRDATEHQVARMAYFAKRAGWEELVEPLVAARCIVEQESI